MLKLLIIYCKIIIKIRVIQSLKGIADINTSLQQNILKVQFFKEPLNDITFFMVQKKKITF